MRNQLLLLCACLAGHAFAGDYTVKSPDGKITVNVETGVETKYSVSMDGKMIISPSAISMTLDNGVVLGHNMNVVDVKNSKQDRTLKPVIRLKNKTIEDKYNEMILKSDKYNIGFRVYDDGVAYRFSTNFSDSLKVLSEEASFKFAEDFEVVFRKKDLCFHHSNPISVLRNSQK